MDLDLADGAVMLGTVMGDEPELEISRPGGIDQIKGLGIVARLGRVGAQIDPRRVGIGLRTQHLKFLGMRGISLVVGQYDLLDQNVLG